MTRKYPNNFKSNKSRKRCMRMRGGSGFIYLGNYAPKNELDHMFTKHKVGSPQSILATLGRLFRRKV